MRHTVIAFQGASIFMASGVSARIPAGPDEISLARFDNFASKKSPRLALFSESVLG
jgi:hypothetical protein